LLRVRRRVNLHELVTKPLTRQVVPHLSCATTRGVLATPINIHHHGKDKRQHISGYPDETPALDNFSWAHHIAIMSDRDEKISQGLATPAPLLLSDDEKHVLELYDRLQQLRVEISLLTAHRDYNPCKYTPAMDPTI
jgi:hypothetical protein